jgi:thiol-disulfide isomerase/thioredoxin
VAREALVAQWSYDQRKALGENVTESDAALQAIRPSLRKANITVEKTNAGASAPSKGLDATASSKGPSDAAKSADANKALPTPAKKEDVVFEVTASNFQKLVLESPVPVLLDVYADWCGPCKQLGPILENAAIKAGGMFRLAKVNSDQERAVAEALGVTGLPTVYTVSQGKLNDR